MTIQKCMGAKNLLFYEEILRCVLNVFENSVLAKIFWCGHEIFIGLRSFVVPCYWRVFCSDHDCCDERYMNST
jgi:hypothetical protein